MTAIDQAAARFAGRDVAIYGSGFYGTWIAQRIQGKANIVAFFDQNPKLQGSTNLGAPVLGTDEIESCDFEALFIGLNPKKARDIIEAVPSVSRHLSEKIWLT
jgi:FlaA1/EpsC-like NDP-sugar epimerase